MEGWSQYVLAVVGFISMAGAFGLVIAWMNGWLE